MNMNRVYNFVDYDSGFEDENNMVHVNFSMRHETPHVCNQKDEQYCMLMCFSDMTGTTNSMYRRKRIVLSPQTMIDKGLRQVESVIQCLTGRDPQSGILIQDYGLEKIRTVPFTRLDDPEEGFIGYQGQKRYQLDDIRGYASSMSMRVALSNNFSEDGYHYPAIGVLRMGRFADPQVAANAARYGDRIFYTENRPIHTRYLDDVTARNLYGCEHALVITGINTMAEDSRFHWCEVKNTHGRRWGDNGFSKISIDLFDYILIPKLG